MKGPKVFWFTGLSGAGKTTLAKAVHQKFRDLGHSCVILDGDELRKGLCKDLGFSPYIIDREGVRSRFAPGDFHEIYVQCLLEVCLRRDPKGLYKKHLPNFTGLSSPYEAPLTPELTISTDGPPVHESIAQAWDYCCPKCFGGL